MTSHSQGIQQLLQAEKRAKDKLEEAKKRKGKRLKQAKEEATAEIDHYRLQREKDFRHKQSNNQGQTSTHSSIACFEEKALFLEAGIEEGLSFSESSVENLEEEECPWKRQKQVTGNLIMGSQGNLSTKIDEETTGKIQNLNSNYHRNLESVLGHILNKVYDFSPELHPNYVYTI
ncbi:hypothetical protein JD844_017450 [Phrynosoma platyrhinos]|uniref:V-type proton ATPase subunit G n=1 Tax=Phrynosoma platyrhinos TaxID=52577 RepID=A0ABQ7SLV3_PHRPL|nr:hypothetical protein JD844_017450 [Phrynosoma platyrhinos]